MTEAPLAAGPVAVFDSGVGGLSVLRHLRHLLPAEDLLYLADQAHVPYGARPAADVIHFSEEISRFFLAKGAKLIVVACNTATAAALNHLRHAFPQVPFVGMEPAIKPGAAQTRSGRVGVLATAGTFESQRYESLMERFAHDVILLENPCTGLVPLIEAGSLEAAETENLLRDALEPMLASGVDTIVLGCTHYPFVRPLIEKITGEQVAIIDPAPAVARQAQRVLQHLEQQHPVPVRTGTAHAFTTGDPARFATMARQLLGYPIPTSGLHWQHGQLQTATTP